MKTMWINVLLIVAALLAAGCGDRSPKSASEDGDMREQPVPAKIRYFNKAKKPVLIKPLDSLVVKMEYKDAGNNAHTIRHGASSGTNPSNMPSLDFIGTKTLPVPANELIRIHPYPFPNGTTAIVTSELELSVTVEHSNAQAIPLSVVLRAGANGDFTGAITVFVTEAPASGGRVTYTVDCVAGYTTSPQGPMQSAHGAASATSN